MSMIGWLPKFVKLKIWQAMILAIIWLATKTCQSLTFGLPNLWQFFYLALACQIFGTADFSHKPMRPNNFKILSL
jgi:hypothetical protein